MRGAINSLTPSELSERLHIALSEGPGNPNHDHDVTALLFPAWVLSTLTPPFLRLLWATSFLENLETEDPIGFSSPRSLGQKCRTASVKVHTPSWEEVLQELQADAANNSEDPNSMERWRSELLFPGPDAPNPLHYPLLSQKGVMLAPSIWVAYCALLASLPPAAWGILAEHVETR